MACEHLPVVSHLRSPFRNMSSVKSSLQSVEYLTPALVSEPFRFSIPTSPRPLTRPVSDGQDWALMRDESGEQMVGVLPNRFGDDHGRFGMNLAKRFHALFLRADETVFLLGVVFVTSRDRVALGIDGLGQQGLHLLLSLPAGLVG